MKILNFAVFLLAAPVSAGAANTHQIAIVDMKFVPEAVDARVGDTVIWENKDIVPHTATAEGDKKAFDSGAIIAGKKYRLPLKKTGEVPYICLFHPMMKGRIRVTR